MVNKCCNNDCNQGRDCPNRQDNYDYETIIEWLKKHAPLTLDMFLRRPPNE